jgi:hypothetical protein
MSFLAFTLTFAAFLLPFCACESNGCFTLEGWKGEDGCSSRLFCDTGSRCNDHTGPLCKFGLYCSEASGTCQPLKPLDANCSAGYDCASGICMEGPQDVPICADATALPCGRTSCGPGMFCRQEGEELQVGLRFSEFRQALVTSKHAFTALPPSSSAPSTVRVSSRRVVCAM